MKGKIKITIHIGLPVDTKHYESDDLEGVAKELGGQYKEGSFDVFDLASWAPDDAVIVAFEPLEDAQGLRS